MKILQLHNFYQQAGGEDAVVRSEKALLESHGHSVSLLEADNDWIIGTGGKIKAALGCLYSHDSKRRVEAELRRFHPDIVHAHNLFPVFSPSVLYACAESNVPVVQTLHNYRMLCPNSILFRNGAACEDCVGKRFAWPAVVHRCYHGSRAGTFTVAALSALHQTLGTYEHKVTRYIALSEFSRSKFIEGGIPAEQLNVKANFLDHDPGRGNGEGNYVLYVGRLSAEKGLALLLRAWCILGTRVPLRIIGTGSMSADCKRAAADNPAIEYLGHRSLTDVLTLMGDAKALMFPSLWYEGFPRTIVESFAKGTPVIASNLGSMQELIEHGRTGLHFDPNSPETLIAQIDWMLSHPDEWKQMRLAARAEFDAKYSAEKNYSALMDIYRQAMSSPSTSV